MAFNTQKTARAITSVPNLDYMMAVDSSSQLGSSGTVAPGNAINNISKHC